MYIYVYIYVYSYIQVYLYVNTYIYVYIYEYAYIRTLLGRKDGGKWIYPMDLSDGSISAS